VRSSKSRHGQVGGHNNQPISPDEVHKVLVPIAAATVSETGVGRSLAQKLSQVLPQAVDKLTPNGAIPKA
jgi:uncharacterized protein YidB (DUF937 family)